MKQRHHSPHRGWHPAIARLTSLMLFAVLAGSVLAGSVAAADLSQYREFVLGATLSDIAQQIKQNEAQAKTVQLRPAMIQELEWRPQSLNSSFITEPVKEATFTFYDGELFRVLVNYDRFQTEGLKDRDLVESISAIYGPPSEPTVPAREVRGIYASMDVLLAEWQDAEYRYELIRLPYGPSYRLVGFLRRLEEPVAKSMQEAKRLDDLEAPQRELERKASELQATEAKDSAARLLNKEKFRP